MLKHYKIENSASRRPLLGVVMAAAILMLSSPMLAFSAQADRTTQSTTDGQNLDWADAASVWYGGATTGSMYIFGGAYINGARLTKVWQWTPSVSPYAAEVSLIGYGARDQASAARFNEWALAFGGHYVSGGVDQYRSDVILYNMSSNSLTIDSNALPSGRSATSAAVSGNYAYIFGGRNGTQAFSDVLRYNVAGHNDAEVVASLPTARFGTSAVHDGRTNIYIFGGEDFNGVKLDEILVFNVTNEAVSTLSQVLPSSRSFTSAFWDGNTSIFVVGGRLANGALTDQIVRFNNWKNSPETMNAALPQARANTTSVWTGTIGRTIGGWTSNTTIAEFGVRYEVSGGGVPDIDAYCITGNTKVTIEWGEPASNTYAPNLTKYRVYRSQGTVMTYVQIGNDRSWSDPRIVNDTTPTLGAWTYTVTSVTANGQESPAGGYNGNDQDTINNLIGPCD